MSGRAASSFPMMDFVSIFDLVAISAQSPYIPCYPSQDLSAPPTIRMSIITRRSHSPVGLVFICLALRCLCVVYDVFHVCTSQFPVGCVVPRSVRETIDLIMSVLLVRAICHFSTLSDQEAIAFNLITSVSCD